MRILRQLGRTMSILLVTVMVALAILLVGVRVVGLTPYTVLSGSMEPTYRVGSLIYVRQIDEADITVGTPITFKVSGGAMLATHRVVEITALDGDVAYITKGDANDVLDPPVKFVNVVGSPVFSIPYLGYFSTWLQSGAGAIAGIALAAMLLLSALLSELLPKPKEPTQPQDSEPQAHGRAK